MLQGVDVFRVYVPEILPLHARAKGTAIGISSNWLWVSFIPDHQYLITADLVIELRCGHDHSNSP